MNYPSSHLLNYYNIKLHLILYIKQEANRGISCSAGQIRPTTYLAQADMAHGQPPNTLLKDTGLDDITRFLIRPQSSSFNLSTGRHFFISIHTRAGEHHSEEKELVDRRPFVFLGMFLMLADFG
jgi:hypothetical protein